MLPLQKAGNNESTESPLSSIPKGVNRKRKLPEVNEKNYHFNIVEILLSKKETKAILDERIPSGFFIRDEERNNIAKVLVDAILKEEGKYPSKETLTAIAKDLVREYPVLGDPRETDGGFEIWYFNESGSPHPSGYLFEKLQNQRRRFQEGKKSKPDVISGATCEKTGWTSEENDDVIPEAEVLFLQSNMVGEEVKDRMRRSVFGRRNLIRGLPAEGIRSKFPRLFDVEGMIVQDFNTRHPLLSDKLYQRWPRISKTLLQYCTQTKDFTIDSLGISTSMDKWTDDQYCMVGFMLLPFIFSKSGRASKVTQRSSRGDKKSSLVRISQKDQRTALFTFVGENISVLETMVDGNPLYPKVVVVGNLSQLSILQSFVAVSEDIIPSGKSFLSAIDTCFKTYFVLGIDFPSETRACWQFMAHSVFGKKFSAKDPLLAPVRALVGQIIPRSFEN